MKRISLQFVFILFSVIFFYQSNITLAQNCDLSGFMTFTQGGWSSPSNSTPGQIRDAHFSTVFPNGLIVGSVPSRSLKLTSATAVKNFLPQGGTSGAFVTYYQDVTSTSAGVFAGQLVAATLNVEYDAAGKLGTNPLNLKDLIITKGTFAGKTVSELLIIANNAISGIATGYTYSEISDALTLLNENFDNGTVNKGFLTCPPIIQKASLGDRIWLDANKNGIQDAGEVGVGNITVRLYDCSNNFIASTVTNANGNYLFSNLTPGQYYIKIDLPSGYVVTLKNQGTNSANDSDIDPTTLKSACINLNPGETNLTIDGGIYQNIQKISPILECVEKINETTYKAYFGYNNPNSFQVEIPVGSQNSFTPAPADRQQPTIFNPGRVYKAFSVTFDGNNLVWSLNGKTATANKNSKSCQASIGDKVWLDVNRNGVQDAGESGVANIVVKLYTCDNLFIASTTTDANGNYLFANLNPGSYYVKFELPANYLFTQKDQGADDSKDSDADEITGKTDCTTLSEGEIDLTWDAGIIFDAPIQCVTNWNGTLGPDEAICEYEAKWITINGSVTLNPNPGKALLQVSWRVVHPTNVNNCPSGSEPCTDEHYFTKWIFGDTTFSISAWWPGISSGDTLIEIHYGLNVLDCNGNPIKNGVGKDLYWYPWVCPPPAGPKPKVTKDDGIVIMPGVGNTTTYTINYKNEGASDLLNSKLIDILPVGVSFVSATGSYTLSADSVIWNLGTLAPGQTGSVSLTVSVTDTLSEYINKVFLIGYDNKNKKYESYDDDINIADTASGGATAGVESKGDMAELLLKRLLKIQFNQTSKMVNFQKAMFKSNINITDLVPHIGPYSSTFVETTPFDIAGISNATSSFAADYYINSANIKNRRIGGIFVTTTNPPYIYDHTKQTCDRLNEYKLLNIELLTIDKMPFYMAKLSKQSARVLDYAISFSVYEMSDGFKIESKWTFDDYKVPPEAFLIYNFQVWSSTKEGTIDLVQKIINKLRLYGNISVIKDFVNLPTIFIREGYYDHNGQINFTVVNNYAPQDVNLKIRYRLSQGGELKEKYQTLNLNTGINDITLKTGILSDAKLYLSTSNNFKDELFVSGGAFTHFSGSNSTISAFNTVKYEADNSGAYPAGALLLSGGYNIKGKLNDWVNVFRTLKGNATAIDLSDYNKIVFTAKGTGKLNVFIELTGTKNYNYFVKTIDLSPNGSEHQLYLKTFTPRDGSSEIIDLRKVEKIGFALEKGINPAINEYDIEIKNIYFAKKSSGEVEPEIPMNFELKQNYPNPFNPGTQIQYFVGVSGKVSLKVYDMLGQLVATLFEGYKEQGWYNVSFDASGLSSGMYLYTLESQTTTISKKMIYMK